ncbi:hypothetical protein SAMN04488005_1005 [Yoonia tamlensis]|uniref:Uncharacterized protein n=1 Tax=Yoonia tamlensis TaxID=390270 RepID=A0A1I6G3H1_9RHOB|nr:hypothetical protein [Yoonia tamlensis]SFR36681.1 hypothetical protein SAMN04488005_1005 [Yoonia tamlensis]
MTTNTPANVAASATLVDVVALDNLIVIGVFIGTEQPAALIRSGQGQIARVSPGESVFGITIAAIDAAQVVLTDHAGTVHVLAVPHS